MKPSSDPGALRFKLLLRYCHASAITVVALGCLVLYGWTFHIETLTSVLPGLVTMKANTALCMALSGASLWLRLPEESRTRRGRVALSLALLVTLIGAISLSQYLFHVNLGIDQLLFVDTQGSAATSSPGRMAVPTAVAFIAIGLALMLLDLKIWRSRWLAQALSLCAGLLAVMAIIRYIYRATVSYQFLLYTQLAVHTAVGLFLMSSAIFFARPRSAIARELTSDYSGSIMARRLLPATFFIPLFLGWLCLRGEVAQAYGTALGMALLATADIVVFVVLIWLSAWKLNAEHHQRSRVEIAIRELNADLERRVAERTETVERQRRIFDTTLSSIVDFAYTFDREGRFVYANRPLLDLLGLTLADTLGKKFVDLPYPSELAALLQEQVQQVFATGQKLTSETEYVNLAGAVGYYEYIFCPVIGVGGTVELVAGSTRDITAHKELQKYLAEKVEELSHANSATQALALQMAHSSEHDSLTGLPNRLLLNDRVDQAIALARRRLHQVAVLFLDLDGFKRINDSMGHPTGDKLLQSIATRLAKMVDAPDTVSRQGGDEFVVLLSELQQAEDAEATARMLLQAVAEVHSVDQRDLHISASIGVSIYPGDGSDAETLIKNADIAMYQAKENGRQRIQFFEPAMNVRAKERQFLEENLHRALEREELLLYYQPKVKLNTGEIVGAEALVRWTHPTRGPISPEQFIPVAEECGLILPIGAWILREACAQARAWAGIGLPVMTMAVNVSAMQFQSETFLESLFEILGKTGLDPQYLELEVTERVLIKRVEFTTSILQILRERGVQVAIDDFGVGYSSLSYLRQFPLDILKIDQSFVRQITDSTSDASIVSAIVSMARSLKLRVVAEGVERPEELAFLQALGCDEAQGFYFGRPMLPAQFAKLLEEQGSLGAL